MDSNGGTQSPLSRLKPKRDFFDKLPICLSVKGDPSKRNEKDEREKGEKLGTREVRVHSEIFENWIDMSRLHFSSLCGFLRPTSIDNRRWKLITLKFEIRKKVWERKNPKLKTQRCAAKCEVSVCELKQISVIYEPSRSRHPEICSPPEQLLKVIYERYKCFRSPKIYCLF